ncbi:MAG: sigma-70 family RNA polymerase sigma factor [Planctomycetes bacterium]|nr:sigma-70 family RNA polymerase sigma factor [Planctomycetota bacterium]
MTDVTRILTAIEDGDTRAVDELLPIVYNELRSLAEYRMARESPGQTLQATALVHEAYLRLLGDDEAGRQWENKGHFFAAAAEAMRRILIDRRAKGAVKRGGGRARVSLVADQVTLDAVPQEILDLDEALGRLAEEDPAKADLVKLRFFAGLSLPQAATVLGISTTTADRHWAYARAWLYNELRREE